MFNIIIEGKPRSKTLTEKLFKSFLAEQCTKLIFKYIFGFHKKCFETFEAPLEFRESLEVAKDDMKRKTLPIDVKLTRNPLQFNLWNLKRVVDVMPSLIYTLHIYEPYLSMKGFTAENNVLEERTASGRITCPFEYTLLATFRRFINNETKKSSS